MNFTIHDSETAPEASRPLLEQARQNFGMVPNLLGVMAEAPGLLEGYQRLHGLFASSSFDAEELTVVWQTINVEHDCHYCVPAHTMIANNMKVAPEVTEALRNRGPMPTEKLQVLHETTLAMVRSRGRLGQEELDRFFAAGYERRQLLELVLGLSQKVMSNYVNAIAETPVDAPFQEFSWEG